MIPFPKIGQYRNVVKSVLHRCEVEGIEPPTLNFLGTVKMHGTNASVVRYPDGRLECQSRSRVITPEKDNYGFAAFIEALPESVLEEVAPAGRASWTNKPVTVYGEWIGRGINSGAAVCQVEERAWVTFAERLGEGEETEWYSARPASASSKHRVFSVRALAPASRIDIDFGSAHYAAESLAEMTNEIERGCPVAAALGAEGTGEGIVWRCVTPGWESSDYWFKVKGEKHSVSKVKTLNPVDIEKMKSVDAFVDATVTESRLAQGIEVMKEMGKPIEMSSTGDYLRWVFNDILAEEGDVMEAAGLTEKDIGKAVSVAARATWFAAVEAA